MFIWLVLLNTISYAKKQVYLHVNFQVLCSWWHRKKNSVPNVSVGILLVFRSKSITPFYNLVVFHVILQFPLLGSEFLSLPYESEFSFGIFSDHLKKCLHVYPHALPQSYRKYIQVSLLNGKR